MSSSHGCFVLLVVKVLCYYGFPALILSNQETTIDEINEKDRANYG
jgi:hypothetical protein